MADDLKRKRAEFAFEQVESWRTGGPKAKKAAEWLPGLPVMLRNYGLLIALLTLRERDGGDVAQAIESWLTRRAPRPPLKSESDADFYDLCMAAEYRAYLAAQWEAIAFAQTLKLVATALDLTKGG